MNYNVGDRVLIRKDLVVGTFYGIDSFEQGMVPYLGKIATITAVNPNSYAINLDAGAYAWTNAMLSSLATTQLGSGITQVPNPPAQSKFKLSEKVCTTLLGSGEIIAILDHNQYIVAFDKARHFLDRSIDIPNNNIIGYLSQYVGGRTPTEITFFAGGDNKLSLVNENLLQPAPTQTKPQLKFKPSDDVTHPVLGSGIIVASVTGSQYLVYFRQENQSALFDSHIIPETDIYAWNSNLLGQWLPTKNIHFSVSGNNLGLIHRDALQLRASNPQQIQTSENTPETFKVEEKQEETEGDRLMRFFAASAHDKPGAAKL